MASCRLVPRTQVSDSETGGRMVAQRGFVSALFDFSFTDVVTPRLAKGLYALTIGGAAVGGAGIALYGLSRSLWLGVLASLLAVTVLIAVVAFIRVWLELAFVVLRLADQTEEIAEQVAGIAVEVAATSRREPSASARSVDV